MSRTLKQKVQSIHHSKETMSSLPAPNRTIKDYASVPSWSLGHVNRAFLFPPFLAVAAASQLLHTNIIATTTTVKTPIPGVHSS